MPVADKKVIMVYTLFPKVSERLLEGRELEFYTWAGDAEELLKNVREKLNMLGEVDFVEYLVKYLINCILLMLFLASALPFANPMLLCWR